MVPNRTKRWSSPAVPFDLVILEQGADWRGWSEPKSRTVDRVTLVQDRDEAPTDFAARVRKTLGKADREGRALELATYVPGPEVRAEMILSRMLIAMAAGAHMGARPGGVLLFDDRELSDGSRRSLSAVSAVVADELRGDVSVLHASRLGWSTAETRVA
jgi:hypothetical protein